MSKGEKKPSESKEEKNAAPESGLKQELKQQQADTNVSTPAAKKADKKATTSKKPSTDSKDKKNPPGEKKPPRKARVVFLTLVFLLAAAAVGIGGYDYWLLEKQALHNKQLMGAQQDFQQRMNLLEQRTASTQTAIAAEVHAREQLAAEQAAVNTALQDISTRLGRTSVAWRLAEVEYLLAIANHRLSLNRDRDTALSILLAADQKIHAMGEPGLLPVRKAIADELGALRALQATDITGLALELGSLIKNIANLPLIDKARIATAIKTEEPAAPVGWRELPLRIWNDIKSLVQVRRHEKTVEPLLPPQEAWFLYQNLRLKLEQARLAVLQGNSKLLQEYLAEADSWLVEFFDSEVAVIVSARESIAAMQQVDLTPQLPDITNSQRLLRDYLAQQTSQRSSTLSPPIKETPPVKEDTDS